MDWEMRAASLILCLGILLATIQNGIAERKIVCYYTNWSVYRPGTAKFSPQNINPYLCTHLIYAFGGFTKENALKPFDKYQDVEKGGYAKFTGLKTYNKNLKTMLAIGGWNEGSSRFSPMVADPARRREFVKNAVKFLRQNHFDGLDLDWEYPTFRDGGKPRDKDNYANLVQELYEEFERESSKTGRPRLLLSMAVPAGIEYIDKGYDIPRLNEYLDFINLLSYDYHSAYEPAVNHHSPLYPLEEDNEYNYDAELTIDYTINHLLEKGAYSDKIILGIPTYGRSYTLFNQEATDLGSPADGPGVEGDATREKGYLAYYEICENIAESDEWEVVQPNPKAMGPYAFKENQWVGYDDEEIVKLKARYVNKKKLGGIMFWSVDNDDFRGKCHGRPYPLIEAAKEALLTDNRNIENTKSVDSRKKIRTQGVQSNARKLGTNSQRSSTTSAPITNRRVSSSRPKYRNTLKSKTSVDEEDREVSRRSYDPSSDIEDVESRNTVRVTEKTERPKNRNTSKTRNSSTDHSSRRKQSRRKGQSKTDEDEGSLSNKLTTPEPPTTPDPGSDFKCEDEGFFPHPRDCKKYFWCLDSGPSGLGVVAHQFTCPSGLVFNKAADSCDYPRNVICPKTLKTSSVVSTTRSPITAATSRTTYLHSTTTAKAEESEEYDSEEDYEDEDEIEETEEEDVREEPKTTTTTKPLVYKTLTRNRPSTTTTTTTTTTTMTPPSEPEREIDSEDEEDPRVIKELIDLIKKAGGIEHLEKQLLLQEKNSESRSDSESVTPATISRSLYERVLNRQTNRFSSGQRPVLSSSETSYVNGPGRAQFEGLDDIPEVKSLRRSQKPQYVTIERPKSSATKESENEEIDENEEDDDNTDVASSEEESISNPLEESSSTRRVTPNYVNIRRTRPSTTTSKIENDVEEKEVEVEKEKPTRRRRPYISKQQNNAASFDTSKSSQNQGSGFRNSEKGVDLTDVDLSTTERNDGSPTIDSRYSNVQRFRGTTSKPLENLSSISSFEITTLPTKLEEDSEVQPRSTTASTTTSTTTTTPTTTTSTSTEVFTVISLEPLKNPSSVSPKVDNTDSTPDSVKLVEDSATEILFTTLPATTSSTTTTRTTVASASKSTIAAVSQPRPFGFARRRFSSSEATTTTTTSAPPSSRSKVSITSRNSTRPSSPFLGRVRSRTRPINRVAEDELVDAPHAEISTLRSKDSSRSRSRGSSRYTPPTSKARTEDVSTNSAPSPRYRERGKTTSSTTVSTISTSDIRRKFRRPNRVSSTESTKTNELDDSPIVKITQGSRRKNVLLRSRTENNDEENDKITNIRVFKRPTVNRELYDRTKQTKKRNNVQDPVQNANVESHRKQIASITSKVLESSTSAESDKNDLTNIVDQEATLVDSLVESNTIEPIYVNHVKPVELIDITTASNKVDYTSDRPDDSIATTTAHIETHEFNPKLVIIVTEHAESTTEAPKRRKVILRKRPISSNNAAVDTIEAEEEERSDAFRRRKVIKRKRPLQDTSSTEVSLEEEAQKDSSLLPESTTSIGDDEDVEKSTIVTDRTGVTPINKDAEELPVAIGYTKEMQDSTLAVTESTLSTDYNFDDFTFVNILETFADEEYPSTREMNVEDTTLESTLATATLDNTESSALWEETLVPGSENLSTQMTTSEPESTRAQITTGLFTTESPSRSTLEVRYARKKFIRKNPVLVSGVISTTSRYPLVSSSTENSSHEILSRRRNNLFTRRHPISSTTVNVLLDDFKNQEEKKDANDRSRDLIGQEVTEVTENTTVKNNSVSANALSADFAEFWKSYTTVSSSDQISNSSIRIEDIDNIDKETENTTYQSTPITSNKSEIRPRYKIPVILKRPFDPEEALSPKRYHPLDSAPEESEETPETKETKLRQSNLRQPRTRYKLQNRDNVKINEEITSSSLEPASTWQYFRTRLYSKHPTSTSTEASVTETLIPARKFDYTADALLRKQQSLKTTTPRNNDPFDSQNLIDPDYTTAKPVTRLVTSVTESGTTERQKILIKTKYSSLTSTTWIPADQFSSTTPSLMTGFDDEAVNEIRQGVEHSTLPIEGEFSSHRYDGRFTTESQEPSTIEIESVFSNLIAAKNSVADSKTIRLPTLKELIGYPTTYYDDDRIATTPSSVFLHNDVDNDISQQNVEESFVQETSESQNEEKEQSIRDIIGEETGDSWLRQASENKARSRTSKRIDEEGTLVTNAVNQEEDRRKTSSTSMYLKPTTMRGIPLVSLTSSPLTRGFYITRSENDLLSSTLAGDFTSSYTTIDSSIERQTETALIPDYISTTDETVTVTHNNQNDIKTDEIVAVTPNDQELELNTFDNNVNDIIKSKGVDNREEKSSTFNSLENSSDSTENPSTYKELDTITIPVSRPASKREKLFRNFDYNTTPLSNVYAVSPTTSTRRRFTLGVVRHNEASIPLWTGKRIVARKRSRIVSPIKEAERRIDESVSHTTTSIFKNASTTSEVLSTLTSAKRKLTSISTTPIIPPIVSESTMSPEILDIYNDSTAYLINDSKTKDSKNRTNAEAAITLTNSIITPTPSVSKIASITSDSTIISTISDDFTSVTTMPSTANETIITITPSSTDAVVKTPMIASDQATIMIESATKSAEIEFPVSMTANHSAADIPTTASTHAIANDSVIIPVTMSIGVEITSPNANHSTDFANMIVPATMSAEVQITSAITNYSVTVPTNTNAIVTDSAVTTEPVITISAGNEIISTVTDSTVATSNSPATSMQEITIDPTITRFAATSAEVETTITNHPAFVTPATMMIPVINTSSSTIISSTHATLPATTSNLLDTDIITVTNMLTTTIPSTVVIPTINVSDDSNVITSANVNVSSNFAITDTLTTSSRPRSNSVILFKDFVTSVDTTSTRSVVPTTLTIESTTTHFNPNDFNISNNSEIFVTTTAKSIQTTEIPTTFETSPIFTSTAISRSLPSTNSAILSTTEFSDRMSENSVTSMITQTPSVVEKSTLSATNDESIATNSIIQTTGIYEPSSVQTMSEESTTPRMKTASEEGAISRKQDQTSKFDDQIGQKTSKSRRVVNRKNNWLGRPVVQDTVNQYPLHRVTLYRGRPRRPPNYTSRVVEQNLRRRITQKRTRVNFQPISSTIRPDEDIVQNTTEDHVAYNRASYNVRRRIVSKRFRERVIEKETTTLQATTLLFQPSTATDNETKTLHGEKVHHKNGNIEKKQSQETLATNKTSIDSDSVNENLSSNFQSNLRMSKNFPVQENKRERMRVVLKSIRPKSEKKNLTEEVRADPDSVDKNFQGNFSINFHANKNFSNNGNRGRRMRVLLRSIRPKFEENNSTIKETSTNIIDENLQNNISNNFSTSENLADEKNTRRRMRIVLRKKIRPEFEEKETKTEEASANSDSTDEILRGAFSNNLRRGKNFPVDKPRKRLRVVLKTIKPKSEKRNSTAKEMSLNSDSIDKDLQGSFSSNFHTNVNLFDEEETRKNIKSTSEEKDSIAEETIAHSDFSNKDFSNNLHVDDLPDHEKMVTHFKYGRKEATIERLEDTKELQTTETFVLVKEDTDQPSLEVNSLKNGGSIGRTTGYSNRYRKPTQSTTNVPLINTFPSTVAIYRRGRPIETTFSSRIDLIEDSGSTAIQNDQKADVSDQSIRAQEFAVTLTDPPLSSSDTGRTLLRDAARRKISTTVAPRTDPAIDRTVISRYDADSRNRQRPKTKSARPTVNSTTRPRRPPVLDYDYYEDETPIVIVGKPFLNSKLFLTNKGTIRCLDQGNFPHPYSCKKFITCARMVNGQVIGTEYTCPDRLTFDPIGGICNWSTGLGCKD